MQTGADFDLKFTSREVTAWRGLALLKRMQGGIGFKEALQNWQLPQSGSNRGYAPEQLIEQRIVRIWCGAARFCHADITRLDATPVRQHVKRKGAALADRTLSLFADDPDMQGWRYGTTLTDLSLPALGVWCLYCGRAGEAYACGEKSLMENFS